jgi:ATP-dependent Lon protease
MLAGIAVRGDVAMTGAITSQSEVTAIGCLKGLAGQNTLLAAA